MSTEIWVAQFRIVLNMAKERNVPQYGDRYHKWHTSITGELDYDRVLFNTVSSLQYLLLPVLYPLRFIRLDR